MNIKIWLRLSMFLSIPLFFTFFINTLAAFTYWTEQVDKSAIKKFNHEFVFWGCIIACVALGIILATQLWMRDYVDKIDRLDLEIEKAKAQQKELSKLKGIYLKLIEKQNG